MSYTVTYSMNKTKKRNCSKNFRDTIQTEFVLLVIQK